MNRGAIFGKIQNVKTLKKLFLISPRAEENMFSSHRTKWITKTEDHNEAKHSASTRYKKNFSDIIECLQNYCHEGIINGSKKF